MISPIVNQFELARKEQLINIGYLDSSGKPYRDPYMQDCAENRLIKSVFSSRNDSILTNAIEKAQPLWRDLWFENECICLFGDPNIGKSTLAFQIGSDIANNGREVVYIDFENMMHNYYEKNWATAQFVKPEGLHVLHFDQNASFEDMTNRKKILDSIEQEFLLFNAPVLIIDDITQICPLKSCNKTNLVLRRLRQWLNMYHISILVIAHATSHHEGTPLTMKNLTGDRQLAYAFDSIISLNDVPSPVNAGGATHYIKHLKARNSPLMSHNDNVITCLLKTHYDKTDCDNIEQWLRDKGNDEENIKEMMDFYLGLRFQHFSMVCEMASERQLLFLPAEVDDSLRLEFIHDCFSKGWSIRNIAAHTNIPKSTVHRILASKKISETVPSQECDIQERSSSQTLTVQEDIETDFIEPTSRNEEESNIFEEKKSQTVPQQQGKQKCSGIVPHEDSAG